MKPKREFLHFVGNDFKGVTLRKNGGPGLTIQFLEIAHIIFTGEDIIMGIKKGMCVYVSEERKGDMIGGKSIKRFNMAKKNWMRERKKGGSFL